MRAPGKPEAMARGPTVRAAVCWVAAVEMAQPLLRQMKMQGALKTPAKFIPTWKSPVEAVPSPKYTAATSSFFESFAAHAMPVACGIWVPTGDEMETMLPARYEWWT